SKPAPLSENSPILAMNSRRAEPKRTNTKTNKAGHTSMLNNLVAASRTLTASSMVILTTAPIVLKWEDLATTRVTDRSPVPPPQISPPLPNKQVDEERALVASSQRASVPCACLGVLLDGNGMPTILAH